MRLVFSFICFLFFSFTWNQPAKAWIEFGFSGYSAFYSFESTDSFGTNIKISSLANYGFSPELIAYLNPDLDRLIFRTNIRTFNFANPPGTDAFVNNNALYLGGDLRYQKPIGWWAVALGFDYQQRPVASAVDATTIKLTNFNYFSVPIEVSKKLIILENNVLRAGASYYVGLNTPSLSSQSRYGVYLRHELRNVIRLETSMSYEVRNATTSTAIKQNEAEFGLNIKMSFPGRKGTVPPPDEIE